MKKFSIIVAGGKGQRMQSELPKQFLSIKGKPILMHTIQKFHEFDKKNEIILVLPEDQIDFWQVLCQKHGFHIPHRIVEGGETRFHSVLNGLNTIPSKGIVAIHDGVRPFVSLETIDKCFATAIKKDSAIPCIKIVDSLREISGEESKALNRENYCLIQTPQIFRIELLKEAYNQPYQEFFTDDASVVESIKKKVHLVDGNKENIKLTTPYDMEIAEFVLSKSL